MRRGETPGAPAFGARSIGQNSGGPEAWGSRPLLPPSGTRAAQAHDRPLQLLPDRRPGLSPRPVSHRIIGGMEEPNGVKIPVVPGLGAPTGLDQRSSPLPQDRQ